jgi:hypothetical protein
MTSLRLATIVSEILHPQYAVVLVFVLAAYKDTGTPGAALLWTVLLLAAVVVPVLVVRRVGARWGYYPNLKALRREDRPPLYLAAMGGLIAFWLLGGRWGAPPTVVSVVLAMLLCGVLGLAINHISKISIHAGGISGAVCALALIYSPVTLPLLVAIPLICWARVRLGRHTTAQVVAGAGLAALVTVATLLGLDVAPVAGG